MKSLYKIAVQSCCNVYLDNTDLGTTEYKLSFAKYKGEHIQILAIAGTNETGDWLKNINLWSTRGIKKVAVDAARDIFEFSSFFKTRDPSSKLLVCGHSKAGPTAIAYKRLFDADWCVAFAPARSLRYWTDRKMENTTLFIDPDDPVSKVGFINFGHPKCNIIYAPNDKAGLSVADHDIDRWVEFVNAM